MDPCNCKVTGACHCDQCTDCSKCNCNPANCKCSKPCCPK
uniref:Metallothionein 6 n=1 Tax=Salpa thompsoni TaxID=569448 RepID=A0A8F3FHG5_9UROC|nr:metallothionein 6 [Salpa thompsoni]